MKIKDLIDKRLPLREQARQAYFLRNKFRTKSRELMKNKRMANSLNKIDPNLRWEALVEKKRKSGLTGDALWRAIIESSMRSREINLGEIAICPNCFAFGNDIVLRRRKSVLSHAKKEFYVCNLCKKCGYEF